MLTPVPSKRRGFALDEAAPERLQGYPPRRELSQFVAPLYLFPGYGCSLLKALFGLQLLPKQLRRVGALEIVERGFHGFVRSENCANGEASIPGVRLGQLGQYAIAFFI
jgi:hypothetical protein